MKKQLFFLAASLLSAAYTLHAGPVDANKAVDIAKNFFAQKVQNNPSFRSSASLTIEYTGGKSTTLRGATAQNLYYVINRGDNQGFVIVSGDDRVPEVLGYSDQGSIKSEDITNHPAFAGFFSEWDRQMQYAIVSLPDRPYVATSALRAEALPSAVAPLLMNHKDGHIAWDQSHPFNYYSPKVVYNSRIYPTVSGCVATGMATVMRWHRWPKKPVGKTSYRWTCKNGSIVLADSIISRDYDKESSNAYSWDLMTPRPTRYVADANAREIGRLLYDVGVAVKMQFGPGFLGGSGTFIEYCAPALIKHFDYKNTAKFLLRDRYTKAQWMNLVKTELQHSPIIYGGISQGGGHCFVIDGYNEQDYVHVDWGWNGMSNGYFLIDILDPGAQGTGGGDGGFQYRQQMVYDLYPNKTEDPATDEPQDDTIPAKDIELSLSAAPTASVKMTNVYYSVDIRINQIKNTGKGEFTGKVGLAIRDVNGQMKLLKTINVNKLAPYTTLPQTYYGTIPSIYFNSYPAGNYLIVPIYSVVVNGVDKWFYFETGTTNATLAATIRSGYISFYSTVATMMNGVANLDGEDSTQPTAAEPLVYPTTAATEINIVAPKGFNRAVVFDASGVRVGEYNLSEGLNTIDLSAFTAGAYVIKVATLDRDVALRFIKK